MIPPDLAERVLSGSDAVTFWAQSAEPSADEMQTLIDINAALAAIFVNDELTSNQKIQSAHITLLAVFSMGQASAPDFATYLRYVYMDALSSWYDKHESGNEAGERDWNQLIESLQKVAAQREIDLSL